MGGPGGMICSVATCKSLSTKAKKNGVVLAFFSFPKDRVLRKEWIRKCYRKDKFNPLNKRVCSRHFKNDDFEDYVKAKLMGTHPKKLKNSAIPLINLRHTPDPADDIYSRSQRAERAHAKENQTLIKQLLSPKKEEDISTQTGEVAVHISEISACSSKESDYDIMKRKFESSEAKVQLLQQRISTQEQKELVLNKRIIELEKQLKVAGSNFEEKVKEVFSSVLTSNQVDIILKKKTKARWTQEELSRAFTLRYFSKRSYLYLKQKLHYPLPGLSTLQQWATNINLIGVLNNVK